MTSRALVLLRARLSGDGRGANLPVAPLLSHALIASVLAWLAGDALGPLGYGVYVLSITSVLVTMPLLGEFGYLLRGDAAADWVGALPVTDRDLRLARTLHVLVIVVWLSLGSVLPAVAFAPDGTGPLGRVLIGAGAIGVVTAISAALLVVQAVLGQRAEPLLVLLQTALLVGAVVGFILGRKAFPALQRLESFGQEAWTWAWPPAWFAAPLGEGGALAYLLPLAVWVVALGLLTAVRPADARRVARGEPLLGLALRPVRALATRFWVRRDERAVFDLVFDALPREREVVLRTYPMVAIPLAFVLASSLSDPGAGREDLLAVLLFTACVYLPVLLLHVPASESYRASWVLATSPLTTGATAGAVIKAVAVRFLVPLYLLLALLAWIESGPHFVLRLALPGFLVSLFVTRWVYPTCVRNAPLSVAPDRIQTKYDWSGGLVGFGLLLAVLAVLVNRFLPTLAHGAALTAALVALELFGERRLRKSLG